MLPHTLAGHLCLAVFLAAAGPLAASNKLDLERTTPVPADQVIPVSDFFRPSLMAEPKLNPSGTHLAALVNAGQDRHQLMVYELKTKKIELLDSDEDNDLYEVNWLDDSRVIFGVGLRKRYGMGLLTAHVGSLHSCYPLLQWVGSRLVAIPLKDRLHPLLSLSPNSLNTGQTGQVAVIDSTLRAGGIVNALKAATQDGDMRGAEESNQKHIQSTTNGPRDGFDAGFLADKEGVLDFAFTGQDGRFTMYRLAGDGWQKSPADLDAIHVIDNGRTHGEVTVLGPRQEGKPRALQFMDAATGKLGDVLLQDQAYDFTGYLYHEPGTGTIIGAIYDRAGPQVAWFNDAYRNLQKLLGAQFPGLVARVVGSDDAGKTFLVATWSDRQPPIYYSLDLAGGSIGLIKKSMPWIDPARMQAMSVPKYKTRDGRALDMYVVLPPGASKQHPAPLVVLVNGFPYPDDPLGAYRYRATWGYNPTAQFLASRGYAVLMPNHRGSAGYEWMFPAAMEWDVAGMADDVVHATRALISSGWVDGRRVAVAGLGSGACLATLSAAAEPSLFRGAIAVDGVFDWAQFLKDEKFNQHSDYAYASLVRRIGNPDKEAARFDAISPSRRAGAIRCPVFVAYEKVAVTYTTQARDMVSQLTRNSVPNEVLVVGDDRYGMSHLRNAVDVYERMEQFLAKHLAPEAPAAAPAAPR